MPALDLTQVIAILPVALVEWGNAQAESFANGGPAFGRVWLSPSGVAPATHSACNVRVNAVTLAQIEAAAAQQTGVSLFIGDDDTWDGALAAAGLVVIVPPDDPS